MHGGKNTAFYQKFEKQLLISLYYRLVPDSGILALFKPAAPANYLFRHPAWNGTRQTHKGIYTLAVPDRAVSKTGSGYTVLAGIEQLIYSEEPISVMPESLIFL